MFRYVRTSPGRYARERSIIRATSRLCVNSEQHVVVEYLTRTEELAQHDLKNTVFQAVLTVVTNNTLLNTAFGLKLLHLRAFLGGKSRLRYSSTHVELIFRGPIYQGFWLQDET